MNKFKSSLFYPILLIKNINKKNELTMFKNGLNYICVNHDIKKELKNELELMLNTNYKNQEKIKKLVYKLSSTNQTELEVEFANKYKRLFFDIELYNIHLIKIIDDVNEIILRDKIWYENKLEKISKEIKEIKKLYDE